MLLFKNYMKLFGIALAVITSFAWSQEQFRQIKYRGNKIADRSYSNVIFTDTINVSIPADLICVPYDTVCVPVNVDREMENFQIMNYYITLSFDPWLLEFSEASHINTLAEMFGEPYILSSVPGKISIAGIGGTTLVGGPSPPSLVNLYLNVISSNNNCTDLKIEDFEFGDRNIYAQTHNGFLCIQSNAYLTALDSWHSPGSPDQVIKINLNNNIKIYGLQFDITYNDSLITVTDVDTGAHSSSMKLNYHQQNNKLSVMFYSFDKYYIPQGEGTVAKLFFDVDSSAIPGTSIDLILQSIKIADSSGAPINGITKGGKIYVGEKGDINGDMDITNTDLSLIIDIIFNNTIPDNYQFWAADLNDDREINIADLVILITKINNTG